jgi:nucleoside phosphorylase
MKQARGSTVTHDGHWLVVSAWSPELARLRSASRRWPAQVRDRVRFGAVGVGLVDAAIGTARLLAQHRPRALLLLGTAGVYPGRDLPLGAAVVIDDTVLLPSLDREVYLPDLITTRAACSRRLMARLRGSAKLPTAVVACPLAITADTTAARAAARRSGGVLENLEAFAVARAARAAGVPFAAVLGIANRVGKSSHREWKQHARAAAAAACEAAIPLLLED